MALVVRARKLKVTKREMVRDGPSGNLVSSVASSDGLGVLVLLADSPGDLLGHIPAVLLGNLLTDLEGDLEGDLPGDLGALLLGNVSALSVEDNLCKLNN